MSLTERQIDEIQRQAGRLINANNGQCALAEPTSQLSSCLVWALDVFSLVAEVRRLRAVLGAVACYDQGEAVDSGFEEPRAARIAREALEG